MDISLILGLNHSVLSHFALGHKESSINGCGSLYCSVYYRKITKSQGHGGFSRKVTQSQSNLGGHKL